MDLDSPFFDRIRVRPKAEEVHPASVRLCEHQNCRNPGDFRAPKGRMREGQFWHFCLEHVRDYNRTYNYFAGLPDDAVSAYQRDAATGHRPTWTMGVNRPTHRHAAPDIRDGFGFFGDDAGLHQAQAAPEPEKRRLKLLERKAMAALDLPETADPAGIKARYKALVKRFHPDANGGDRSSEDKLREIIQAYNTLRSAGLC